MDGYIDGNLNIVGVGEAFESDDSTNLNTHGSTACTDTILTMVSDPRVKFRKGDVIKVTTSGTDYRRIEDIDATTITLESALPSAPGTSVAIYRHWRLMGATKGGLELAVQQQSQEITVDQQIDPIDERETGRTIIANIPLTEANGDNFRTALNLESTQVTKSGTKTTVKVGKAATSVPRKSYLMIGENIGGEKVTIKIHKAKNTGQVTLKMANDGQAIFALALKALHDSSQATGEEVMVIEIDTAHNFAL